MVLFLQKTQNMNTIQVILTLDMENLPANFQEIMQQEQAMVVTWKAKGIIEHLYLRETRNGAVLMFKDLSEAEVKEMIEALPFFPLSKSIEYFNLIKQF
jgi:muconolactone D-isomerase